VILVPPLRAADVKAPLDALAPADAAGLRAVDAVAD
jgi:hypothetical protein